MEERGRSHGMHLPRLAPRRRARGKHEGGASFSTSLLDTIYHSFDEGADPAAAVVSFGAARRSEEKTTEPPQFWWVKEAARQKQVACVDYRGRLELTAVARPRHSGYASSSDSSMSSYTFSCSSASTTDTESTHRRRSPPLPPEEVVALVDSTEGATPPNNKAKKSRPCFPGARLRSRDAAPSSPGGPTPPSPAKFACVLKALFTSARLPRKPKTPTAVPSPQALPSSSPQPSRTTSATSTTKTTERRSVRFCSEAEASVVRRRVEELVRSLEELEEDGEGSDSSSDLFELESISGANGGELPVYGTTRLVTGRAIVHGAVSYK